MLFMAVEKLKGQDGKAVDRMPASLRPVALIPPARV